MNHNNTNECVKDAFFAWQIAIALFEQQRVGILISTANGEIIKSNNKVSKILGFSQSELLNYGWKSLTHEEDLELDIEFLKKTQDGKIRGYSILKRYKCKNGSFKPVIVTPYKLSGIIHNNIYVVIVEEYNGTFIKAELIKDE